MKIGKIVMLMIVCSLFIVSINSVVAVDETITDAEDDVLFLDESMVDFETTDQKPNIDIVGVGYKKVGKQVTLTLTVKGNIEDRGDIDDNESTDFVAYFMDLGTSEGDYLLTYINKECTLNGLKEGVSCDAGGSTLTFTFDVDSLLYPLIFANLHESKNIREDSWRFADRKSLTT